MYDRHPLPRDYNMPILILCILMYLMSTIDTRAKDALYSDFKCTTSTGEGTKGNLNWWDYTYSGFTWINCRVETDRITITSVKINGGNCSAVDNLFLRKEFLRGENIKITHSCMDPVTIELTGNGKTSLINLE